MAPYINPLDFRKILVELLLGKEELFLFGFVICFSFVSAKMGMSNKIFLILLTLGSVIFSMVLGEAIYMLIIFLTGFLIFGGIKRAFT